MVRAWSLAQRMSVYCVASQALKAERIQHRHTKVRDPVTISIDLPTGTQHGLNMSLW